MLKRSVKLSLGPHKLPVPHYVMSSIVNITILIRAALKTLVRMDSINT